MKKFRWVLLGAILLFPISWSSGSDSTWMTRPGVPENGYEEAVAIAVDDSGNVYVTGHSTGKKDDHDILTIKYNPNGDTAWTRRFIGPKKNGDERAVKVAVDGSGNSYVAGYITSKNSEKMRRLSLIKADSGETDFKEFAIGESDYDIATIKYSLAGEVIWSSSYSGKGGVFYKNDIPVAMAVDQTGNVLLACTTDDSGQFFTLPEFQSRSYGPGWEMKVKRDPLSLGMDGRDYLAIKLSLKGETLWSRVHHTAEKEFRAMVNGLAVDREGNVYLTGAEKTLMGGLDYCTIKYSPDGDSIWLARFNGPRGGADVATAMAVNDSGNVFVTGQSRGIGTGYNYVTIKYNKNGVMLWTKRYDGPGKGLDSPTDIAVDDSGHVFVTGSSSAESFDYATIKYTYYGDTVWIRRYDGPGRGQDLAKAMAVDRQGNVYVTGRSLGSGTDYDFATIKYAPNGDTLWIRRYDGQKNGGADGPNALVLDEAGNVYVTSTSWGGESYYDYLTIKYSPDGEEIWVKRYASSAR